ncbi:hypothetical protein BRC72_06445 [Halobacteriales archaeon QH_7_66_36]|nr:MAG: hypothetical protein BRC72_06445 [Halobacteriales archaeon QH_7_66_36]
MKLDSDVYDRVKARKRDDETFSEAIERLIGGRGVSLLDLADGEEYDEEAYEERLETLDRAAEADERDLRELEEERDPRYRLPDRSRRGYAECDGEGTRDRAAGLSPTRSGNRGLRAVGGRRQGDADGAQTTEVRATAEWASEGDPHRGNREASGEDRGRGAGH